MKICPRCAREFEGSRAYCVECKRAYERARYHANPEARKAAARALKAKNRRQVYDLKESTPCADCGGYFPHYVMDYDHLPGTEKSFGVSRQSNFALIKAEIEKCELVCANCHRVRTHQRAL